MKTKKTISRWGWLSVYTFTNRTSGEIRYRWRVCGADGTVLVRSERSFVEPAQAQKDARRVSGLLQSVFMVMDRKAA